MKKKFFYSFLIFFTATNLYLYASTPKFSIVPAPGAITNFDLPVGSVATVPYTVTNNTKITRTLTMVPIQGVTQTTSTGGCANPFTLAPHQSCTLILSINGDDMPGIINAGPEICKTNGSQNTPDYFLCSQACGSDKLHITKIDSTLADISATPTTLQMTINTSNNIITVTNDSQFTTAKDIVLRIPESWKDVTANSSNCQSLSPGASCTISITTGANTHSSVITVLGGTNTTEVPITLEVISAVITVNPNPLTFAANSSGTITVTNNGPSTATSVSATKPSAWTDVTLTISAGCASLASGSSDCTMTFTSTSDTAHGGTSVAVSGHNTNTVDVLVTITKPETANLEIGNSPVLLAQNFLAQPITVTNQSSSVTANNITATDPAGDVSFSYTSNCAALPPSDVCTITIIPQVASTNGNLNTFSISGTNTSLRHAQYQIIQYDDAYQSGLVFAIFNTTPLTGSVVLLDTLGAYVYSGSDFIDALDNYDGATNTNKIATSQGATSSWAAVVCSQYQGGGYTTWYLPAICQISNYPNCAGNPTEPNIYQNTRVKYNYNIWSSTHLASPSANAYIVNLNTSTISNQPTTSSLFIFCVHDFSGFS